MALNVLAGKATSPATVRLGPGRTVANQVLAGNIRITCQRQPTRHHPADDGFNTITLNDGIYIIILYSNNIIICARIVLANSIWLAPRPP
jgi:hypothetical protein